MNIGKPFSTSTIIKSNTGTLMSGGGSVNTSVVNPTMAKPTVIIKTAQTGNNVGSVPGTSAKPNQIYSIAKTSIIL
jgi:hypothetical protein